MKQSKIPKLNKNHSSSGLKSKPRNSIAGSRPDNPIISIDIESHEEYGDKEGPGDFGEDIIASK